MFQLPPKSTLFPYTTLFRSVSYMRVIGTPVELSWQAARRAPATLAAAACRRCRSLYHRSSMRSEEHTSELQSPYDLVCRLLLEKKKYKRSMDLWLSTAALLT